MNREIKIPPGIHQLICEAQAIEQEQAIEAGALGYMSRSMVQASLPNRKVEGTEYTRTNGNFTLSLLAPSAIGLPYGTIPRLLMVWLATEAFRTQERQLHLGNSLTSFMRQLDMQATGGRNGSITRLKEQSKRLFATSITGIYENSSKTALINQRIADRAAFWWDTKEHEQPDKRATQVLLSEDFFKDVTEHPVPIDLRAIHALKNSPLALDIYTWLTYRASYARTTSAIPWEALAAQFGCDYARLRNFKASFLAELAKVCVVYPEVNFEVKDHALVISPMKPHIPKKGRIKKG